MAVLLLTDGRLQTDGFLCDAHDLADLIHGHVKALGGSPRRWVVAVLMQQLAGHLLDLVDRLDHVHGDADGAGLVGDGAGDGLTDPPRCVGGELEALVWSNFSTALISLGCLPGSDPKLHAAAHIALGDGDDQTQVGLAQALLGLLASGPPAEFSVPARFPPRGVSSGTRPISFR